MRVMFKQLDIGERFSLRGEECIKIKEGVSGVPLHKQEPNAISLETGHRLVIGVELGVEKLG